MTFLTAFPGKEKDSVPAIWQVINISGTIRSCQVKAIKCYRKDMVKVLERVGDEQTRKFVEESLQATEQTIRTLEA
jgi:hypothetical protein